MRDFACLEACIQNSSISAERVAVKGHALDLQFSYDRSSGWVPQLVLSTAKSHHENDTPHVSLRRFLTNTQGNKHVTNSVATPLSVGYSIFPDQ
jgi:hypothetical protein